jgi:hypothetical protein
MTSGLPAADPPGIMCPSSGTPAVLSRQNHSKRANSKSSSSVFPIHFCIAGFPLHRTAGHIFVFFSVVNIAEVDQYCLPVSLFGNLLTSHR